MRRLRGLRVLRRTSRRGSLGRFGGLRRLGDFAKGRRARKGNEIRREEDVRRKAQGVRTGRKEEGREAVVGEFERSRRFEVRRLTNFRTVGAGDVERRVVANKFGAILKNGALTFGVRFGEKNRERGRVGDERVGVFDVFNVGERETARKFLRTSRREERVQLLKTTATSGGDFRVGRRFDGRRVELRLNRSRRLKRLV